MEYVEAFFTNKILFSGFIAWATAQVIKAILYTIVNKEFKVERLFGDGGMPSCHSATVCSVATACAVYAGLDSGLFALSVIFAIVVMHDAMGVRLESGKHAMFLNDIIDMFKTEDETWKEWQDKKFKEFVGHTSLQVTIGGMLGVIISLLLNLVIWA